MMQSAHSPTPPTEESNGSTMPATEVFDDPFYKEGEDDLALDTNTKNEVGTPSNNESADPWAVLAAAAGEDAPPPVNNTADTAVPIPPATELTHTEGENFSMPGNVDSSQQQQQQSSGILASFTTNLSHKIEEIDAKTGISKKSAELNDQYHISEKWSSFNEKVIKPTTEKTVAKTNEVKEKVAPSVKEHWDGIKVKSSEKANEMGISQKWGSITAGAKAKLEETKSNVEHWKEEQEKKKALQNSGSNGSINSGSGATTEGSVNSQTKQPIVSEQQQQQIKENLELTKVKVVEGWNGGMNWLSQKINDAKAQHEQKVEEQKQANSAVVNRTDSDGLPSSFRKD